MANPSAYHFGDGEARVDSPGSVTFLKGDFFTSNWDFKGDINVETRFDLAYDYTVSSNRPFLTRGC